MTTFFGTYFSVKKNFDLWKSGRRSRRASERINKYSTAPGVYDGSVAGLQLFHLFRGSRFPIAVFIIFITIISTPGTTTMNSHAADRGARGMFQYFCVRFKFCFFLAFAVSLFMVTFLCAAFAKSRGLRFRAWDG